MTNKRVTVSIRRPMQWWYQKYNLTSTDKILLVYHQCLLESCLHRWKHADKLYESWNLIWFQKGNYTPSLIHVCNQHFGISYHSSAYMYIVDTMFVAYGNDDICLIFFNWFLAHKRFELLFFFVLEKSAIYTIPFVCSGICHLVKFHFGILKYGERGQAT